MAGFVEREENALTLRTLQTVQPNLRGAPSRLGRGFGGMQMRKLVLAVLAAASLTGCATFKNIETGLAALEGQPVQAAFDRLGYPDGQMNVGADTVYVWGRSFMMNMPQYNTATTYGTVGTTPYTANTGVMTSVPMQMQCSIKIAAGPDGVIKTWQYNGNVGGCSAYSSALKVR